LFAGFVEAAVDPVDVEQAVELRPETEEPRDQGHDAAPHTAIEPIAHARPPRVEGNHGDAVKLIHIKAIAKPGPQPWRGFFEGVGRIGLRRFVAVEPPAETEAEKDN